MRSSTKRVLRSYVRHPFRPTTVKLMFGPRTRLVQRAISRWHLHKRPRGWPALYLLLGKRRRAALESLGRKFGY